MKADNRRKFITHVAAGTIAGIFAPSVMAKTATPGEVEGPFYPITEQKDKDADLTIVEGKEGNAQGEIIDISGNVINTNGVPVEEVSIDLWQANAHGKYHHPHDNSDAPTDEHFQSWAILQSDHQGHYKFRTIIPGAYPLGATQQRTPHIHFKISKTGYKTLVTQLYFPNQPLNEKDGLYKRKSKTEQKMMTAKLISDSEAVSQYRWDIIIQQL